MKLWLLTNPPPVSEDTAYLIGRVLSYCRRIEVTAVGERDESTPEPPQCIDGILNRSFNVSAHFLLGLDALGAQLGIPVINPGRATFLACDKRLYPQMYPGLVPDTRIVSNLAEIAALWRECGRPLVLKGPFGKRGEEVILYRGEEDAKPAAALLAKAPEGGIVAQEFCEGFREGDARVILHRRRDGGFEIAAWFRRMPPPGGWKSNVSAGGRIRRDELAEDEKELALEVAARAGLDYIGVDLGRHEGRCLLIETNAYTGGQIDFDIGRRDASSGDDFARLVAWLCREGRSAGVSADCQPDSRFEAVCHGISRWQVPRAAPRAPCDRAPH